MGDKFYLRPVPLNGTEADSKHDVELILPFAKKKYLLSSRSALDLIYSDRNRNMVLGEDTRERVAPSDVEHWDKRNWTWSLPYYLFSRVEEFSDSADDTGQVRHETLRDYQRNGHLPPVPSFEDRISLPPLTNAPSTSLGEVLRVRRSLPRPQPRRLSLEEFSNILTLGFHRVRELRKRAEISDDPVDLLRSLGSALDIYVSIYNVDGISPGIYYYSVYPHELGKVQEMEEKVLRASMQKALAGQSAPTTAAATVTMIADFERYQWRYRHERALRNLYVDTGIVAGQLLLAVTSFQKQVHITPAARDSEALSLFQSSPERHQLLYNLSFA
ncbi:hypothetical protein [Nocardiopsis sp. NPDC006938]|uniref:hypothetical protein n=1 Tax=Nocardiopsis sp. NPDC006938 TaxID=3364337 RepID=UPI00369382FD